MKKRISISQLQTILPSRDDLSGFMNHFATYHTVERMENNTITLTKQARVIPSFIYLIFALPVAVGVNGLGAVPYIMSEIRDIFTKPIRVDRERKGRIFDELSAFLGNDE
jgi:hypothetical protein